MAAGRPATLPAGAADRKGRWRSGARYSGGTVINRRYVEDLQAHASINRPLASKARLGEVVTCEVGGAAQVEGAVALSVVVRSGPIMTAVNGTVVARPEDNLGMPVAAGSTLTIG